MELAVLLWKVVVFCSISTSTNVVVLPFCPLTFITPGLTNA
jgi:hypothetical protein